MSKKRMTHSPAFKAKVALAAQRQDKTISQLAAHFKVHPTVISKWKAQLLDNAAQVFQDGRSKKKSEDRTQDELYQEIGRLKVELDWVKKNLKASVKQKRLTIEQSHPTLSCSRQCQLLDLPRSTYYYEPIPATPEELDLMARIDEFHFEYPMYGSRRLAQQFGISRDKATRIMQLLHLVATYPKRRTTIAHHDHKKYPYLLRDVVPNRPNHIWSTDITYIGLSLGFVYLTAIIDWYSRKILAWRLSNTMDVGFCIECLDEAFEHYGEPEFFNSDQGSQFTSPKFLSRFAGRTTKNSMDGRGRWLDNVYIERFWWTAKYECMHLRGFSTMCELQVGLERFMHWYNEKRIHSSLLYHVPDDVYSGRIILPMQDVLVVAR